MGEGAAEAVADGEMNRRWTKAANAVLLTSVLVSYTLTASAQLFLNAGDAYTFEFDSLPLSQILPCEPPCGGFGTLFADFFTDSYAVLALQAFESSLNEPPIAASEHLLPGGSRRAVLFGSFWEDRQGAVRITMLSGSATLNGFLVERSEWEGGGLDLYSLYITPSSIPEPQAGVLLLAFVTLAFLKRRSNFGIFQWRHSKSAH